jgi:hypothetical protein
MAMPGLDVLDWVLNSTQVCTKLMMLRKTWWAPVLGLLSQALFIAYAWITKEWGFLITPAVMIPLYSMYVKKWYIERYEHEYIEEHCDEYFEEELDKHPKWTPWDVPYYPDPKDSAKLYRRHKTGDGK